MRKIGDMVKRMMPTMVTHTIRRKAETVIEPLSPTFRFQSTLNPRSLTSPAKSFRSIP